MTPEELTPLVERLRQGDNSVKATIIGDHMRLCMSIVAKYAARYPYLVDDMVGAAMMGACQAVDWAPTRMYDNNITPYIYQTCERFIKETIEHRLVIYIPRRRFTTLHEEADAFVPLVQTINATREEDEDDYDLLSEHAARTVGENPLLFEELLESLALTARDRTVVDMLIENYTQVEIAEAIGVTPMAVSYIKQTIGEKLRRRL